MLMYCSKKKNMIHFYSGFFDETELLELEIFCIIINFSTLICPSWINVSISNFCTVVYIYPCQRKRPSIYVHPSLKAHNSNIIKYDLDCVQQCLNVRKSRAQHSYHHFYYYISWKWCWLWDSALCNISTRKHEKVSVGSEISEISFSTPQQMRETQNTNETPPWKDQER